MPADFKVMVPVWAQFDGDRASQVVLTLDQASERFEFPVPDKPEKLTINPRHEVLALVLEKE